MANYYEKGKTAPNQDLVTVGPHKHLNGNFIQVSKDDFAQAARLLKDGRGTPNGGALILYMYFQGNAEGWSIGLSPKAIQQNLGLGESAYNSGKKLLIEKGFLVETSKHHYTFYESPIQNSQNAGFGEEPREVAKTGGSDVLDSNKTSDSNVLPSIKTFESLRQEIYNININNTNIGETSAVVSPGSSVPKGTSHPSDHTSSVNQERKVVGYKVVSLSEIQGAIEAGIVEEEKDGLYLIKGSWYKPC